LDCYDSQTHSEGARSFYGATGLDRNHKRIIRSSPNCVTPFMGRESTGASFQFNGYTGSIGAFYLNEEWFELNSLSLGGYTNTSYGSTIPFLYSIAPHVRLRNLVVHDSYNTGTDAFNAVELGAASGGIFYNCIVKDIQKAGGAGSGQGRGLYMSVSSAARGIINNLFYNCKSWAIYTSGGSAYTTLNIWNNAAQLCSGEYSYSASGGNTYCGWNMGDGTTSDNLDPEGTDYKNSTDITGSLDENLLAISGETLYWNGSSGDRAGRNPLNDLCYYHDFDGFFPSGEYVYLRSMTSYSSAASQRDWRIFVNANGWNKDVTRIKVRFTAHNTSNSEITEASIGQISTPSVYNFSSTPTRITFDGGNNGKTISAGQTIDSDWITYSGEEYTFFKVHLFVNANPHYYSYNSNFFYNSHYKNNTSGSGETFNTTISGYSTTTNHPFVTGVITENASGETGVWNLDIRGQARSTAVDAVWPVGPSIPYDEEAEPPTSGEVSMPMVYLF